MTEQNASPPANGGAPINRDAANWARPVDRLSAAGVAGAKDDAAGSSSSTRTTNRSRS